VSGGFEIVAVVGIVADSVVVAAGGMDLTGVGVVDTHLVIADLDSN
jgi:hypothetical protein